MLNCVTFVAYRELFKKFKSAKISLKFDAFVTNFCYTCSSFYICCRRVTFVASKKMLNCVTFVVDLVYLLSVVSFVRVVTFVAETTL